MDYDPIKDFFGRFFNANPLFQRLFFALLDLFFLRAWHVKKELRSAFSLLKAKKPVQVLDAGTGFGQYAFYICRTFSDVKVLGVDVKRDYLDNARRFFEKVGLQEKATFAYEDLTDLKTEGPFDLILSVDVMEHIEDDRAVFRNFSRVLNPGGVVIINTPSDLGGSDVQGETEESFIGEHVRDGYNMDELKSKLLEAGLTTVRATYTYGKYGSFAWRLLIKYPMQMMSTSTWFVLFLPIYYIPVLPIGLVGNALDVRVNNEKGTGVLVVATKKT